MTHIQQLTNNLLAKIEPRRGTPEQVERARSIAMQEHMNCQLGCTVCGGIGYVSVGLGKVEACPNVSSRKLYPGDCYGLSEAERDLRWEDIAAGDGVDQALEVVRQALERGAGWVYLWGPPGLAKTLILKTAVALSLEAHRAAAYTRMVEILDDMRAAFDAADPSVESQRRLDWWADLPLLAIDEFDRLRTTPYALERRFLLMDRRYENALRVVPQSGDLGASKLALSAKSSRPFVASEGNQPFAANFRRGGSLTLMAANEDPALLDDYLYDRIRDGRFSVVRLEGKSIRPAMGWE